MLKKLLKINIAALLAASSASVISMNNIIFAEENSQGDNNSNVEQKGFVEEPKIEMPVDITTDESKNDGISTIGEDSLLTDDSEIFKPVVVTAGIDKEKRGLTFTLDQGDTNKEFYAYYFSIYTIDEIGGEKKPQALIKEKMITKDKFNQQFWIGNYGKDDLEKGLIYANLEADKTYWVQLGYCNRTYDWVYSPFDGPEAVWKEIGHYGGQVDTPKAFNTKNSDDYSTEFNKQPGDIELTLKNLTDGYEYAISKVNNEEENNLDWKTAENSLVTFTELDSGARYYVYSKGVDTVGDKINSKCVVSENPLQVATSPYPCVTDLKANPTSGTEINLSWVVDNVGNIAKNIQIERDGQIIKSDLAPTATSYSDQGLEPGSTYKYTVTVLNTDHDDGIAKSVTASTIPLPTIVDFKVTGINQDVLGLEWKVLFNDPDKQQKSTVTLAVKVDDGVDQYKVLETHNSEEAKGGLPLYSSGNGKKYVTKDVIFKLTVTTRIGERTKEINYLIKAARFDTKSSVEVSPEDFDYTGSVLEIKPQIKINDQIDILNDWYTTNYYKKNGNQYEKVDSVIDAGEYEVRVELTELGKNRFENHDPLKTQFKVNKIDQPGNATIIKDYSGTNIIAGDSLVYQLGQKDEVKGDAKVEYSSATKDVVTVDKNGIMTLVSAGDYTINSKILESTNYKEKELASITGKITAGSLSLASTTFTTKVNTQFNLDENVLFKTEAGKSIKGSELGSNNSVIYTVKANDLGVATGEATSIKPTKSGKLTVTVEVKQTSPEKALYTNFEKDVEINVEAISSGGSGGSSSSSNGWKSNGSYYEKGKPANGIKEIKGVTYFFNEKGFPIKNQMIVIKEKTYITDGEGIFRKGKTEFEGATYVLDKTDGHMLKDWALVDGEWYFMNYETGKVHMNLWAPSASGDWYFMDAEGHMKKNQWIAASEGRWYYVGADGKMVSNGSVDGCWINEQGIYLSPMYKG